MDHMAIVNFRFQPRPGVVQAVTRQAFRIRVSGLVGLILKLPGANKKYNVNSRTLKWLTKRPT